MIKRWSLFCALLYSATSFHFIRPIPKVSLSSRSSHKSIMASAATTTTMPTSPVVDESDTFSPKPRLVVFDLDACVWFPEMYHVRDYTQLYCSNIFVNYVYMYTNIILSYGEVVPLLHMNQRVMNVLTIKGLM